MKKIKLQELIDDNGYLKQINSVSFEDKEINNAEISRPGIELNGYLDHYQPKRVQLYGVQEFEFMKKNGINEDLLDKILLPDVPFIIFSRNQIPDSTFLKIADEHQIPVFKSEMITSKIFSTLYEYLEDKLAPETTVHGVMMSIYGTGVLIKGASGIGKSEVALELVKRGHVLVADDSVVLRKVDGETLKASAPQILKNKMEIRGIGIVDIQKLYGVTSVKVEQGLDLIIELTNSNQNIERIGTKQINEQNLDVSKEKIVIPVLTGKNISNLIEVAVADHQLKHDYNFDAAQEFVQDLNNLLITKGNYENS